MDTCPDCGSNATPVRCQDHGGCYQCPDCLFCDNNPSAPASDED